jgi:hypothetical protein
MMNFVVNNTSTQNMFGQAGRNAVQFKNDVPACISGLFGWGSPTTIENPSIRGAIIALAARIMARVIHSIYGTTEWPFSHNAQKSIIIGKTGTNLNSPTTIHVKLWIVRIIASCFNMAPDIVRIVSSTPRRSSVPVVSFLKPFLKKASTGLNRCASKVCIHYLNLVSAIASADTSCSSSLPVWTIGNNCKSFNLGSDWDSFLFRHVRT